MKMPFWTRQKAFGVYPLTPQNSIQQYSDINKYYKQYLQINMYNLKTKEFRNVKVKEI